MAHTNDSLVSHSVGLLVGSLHAFSKAVAGGTASAIISIKQVAEGCILGSLDVSCLLCRRRDFGRQALTARRKRRSLHQQRAARRAAVPHPRALIQTLAVKAVLAVTATVALTPILMTATLRRKELQGVQVSMMPSGGWCFVLGECSLQQTSHLFAQTQQLRRPRAASSSVQDFGQCSPPVYSLGRYMLTCDLVMQVLGWL